MGDEVTPESNGEEHGNGGKDSALENEGAVEETETRGRVAFNSIS